MDFSKPFQKHIIVHDEYPLNYFLIKNVQLYKKSYLLCILQFSLDLISSLQSTWRMLATDLVRITMGEKEGWV